MKILFKLLIASCLVGSFVTDARIIRGAGRGGITVSFPTILVLTAETNLLPITGQLRSDYERFGASNTIVTPPGFPMLMSVPNECFVSLDGSMAFTDDPCYYEFDLGDPLQLTGAFSRFFNLAENFQQTWSIYDSSTALDPLFEFSSPFTSVQSTSNPGLREYYRELYLDVPAPPMLTVGEYFVSTEVTFTAPVGFDFYQTDPAAGEQCIMVGDPLVEECFLVTTNLGDSLTYNSIWRERLRVVNSPEPLLIMSLSVLLLFIRSKRNGANLQTR